MKNLYTTFFLISFGIIASLSAQTLKNIHRHNQPVLRIPTHLIDKVETADINGERMLKVIQLNGFVSQIPLSQIDSITHSEGQAVDPAQLGNLRTASVMGVVTGPTGAPEMNAIVRSPYGGEETRTDPNGVFFLNNILVYDKLGYITITKPGFHQGSRSFLPLENGSNRLNVQLLSMIQSGSFSAVTGGTVTSGLLQLSFPANAIQLNGQPYSGTVNVFAEALDPTSTAMFDQIPGELLGGMNDSLRLLRSFGMAGIELRDENMNELQLADSVFSTLTFTIPASLQAEAPTTIDWWSFDEEQGIWIHEGMALKQGNQYVGQASHFSWWSLEVPGTFNEFYGIVNSSSGAPVSDAQLKLISPTNGNAFNYTSSFGEFSGRIPKNQTLILNINLICDTSNTWALAHSEDIISDDATISGNYIAELNGYYPITGMVVDCESQPIESGYVKIGLQVFLTINGEFTIQTCQIGEYSLRGFNISNPDSILISDLMNVQVDIDGTDAGNLVACSTMLSSVNDIDGNVYETVLIGDQWWMAENLRTTSYSNGDAIPNVTNNTAWTQVGNGAYCYLNNLYVNNTLYGALYNWYTTVDPRNLCPVDWHVPTDHEWTILIEYLGGESLAGGKMKSVTSWDSPNTAANNESGFSGLGGGWRANVDGTFSNVGFGGYWWSSTENVIPGSGSLVRVLNNYTGNVNRYFFDSWIGLSVRCIKD